MLNVGDLVRLKSGGPLMTVAAVDGDQISCIWFGSDHTSRRETFPEVLLTEVTGDVRAAASALSRAVQLRVSGRTWNFPDLRSAFTRRRPLPTPAEQPVHAAKSDDVN